MNACKHEHLSDWETASFDDNFEGVQGRRCKDCEVVKKRTISSDYSKERLP